MSHSAPPSGYALKQGAGHAQSGSSGSAARSRKPGERATEGYFNDDSMLRRLNRERVMALSGPRALLMQAAHPLAVTGLLAHSSALDAPYERLARTAKVMHTIGFGSRDDADSVTRHVRAMHRSVRGRLKEPVGRYVSA